MTSAVSSQARSAVASRMLMKACLWITVQLTMSEILLRCVSHLHSGKAGDARTLDPRLPAAESGSTWPTFATLCHEIAVHPLSGNLPLLPNRSQHAVHLQERCEPPQTLGRG